MIMLGFAMLGSGGYAMGQYLSASDGETATLIVGIIFLVAGLALATVGEIYFKRTLINSIREVAQKTTEEARGGEGEIEVYSKIKMPF